MANKSNSENRSPTIDDIINEIKRKSEHGDYIYRGERQPHCKVSSALYREYEKIDIEEFDLREAQSEMLDAAKLHVGEPHQDIFEDHRQSITSLDPDPILTADEIEILTELQHYGGKTNLIDFTTDYLIAIFFACAGHPEEDGHVILLQQITEEIEKMIIRPQNPERRVIAQKSIFLYPREGFIKVPDSNKVTIPATLKEPFLKHLRKYHDISTETIYNDIHGFIRNQNIYQRGSLEYYAGLTFQKRGYNAQTDVERQEQYKAAIKHYDQSIELQPVYGDDYAYRGECWLHLGKWDEAKKDLNEGKERAVDLIASFRKRYKNVAEFKEKTGLTIPLDIAEMLGG